MSPPPLEVGLNLIFLVPGETGGMEVYARELARELAARDDVRVTAFVNREAAGEDWGEGVREVVVPVWARRRHEWVLGEQWHLPPLAHRAGCRLVHNLASTAPLVGRFVRVTTIHDLNYRMVPEAHFGIRRLGMAALVPAAARRSHRVIVDAGSTARDLEHHLRMSPAKIDVVPLGVAQEPAADPTPEQELRERFGLGQSVILLSVSAKRPHKNLVRLLDAHAGLDPRPVLVVPGYETPHEAELVAHARRLGTFQDVRFIHWVSRADLEGLYAAATAFVFPSLYEGFGLAVLEAMRRHVPVACSDRSSLPEVAGDAALSFDPESVEEMRTAIARLLGDEPLRERMIEAGAARAARFTWRATAQGTVESYRRALGES